MKKIKSKMSFFFFAELQIKLKSVWQNICVKTKQLNKERGA